MLQNERIVGYTIINYHADEVVLVHGKPLFFKEEGEATRWLRREVLRHGNDVASQVEPRRNPVVIPVVVDESINDGDLSKLLNNLMS